MPFKQHVVIVCVFVFMCARRFLATRQAAHAIQAAWRQLQLRRQLHARLAEEREKERAARQEQEQFVSLRKQYGCVTGLSCCWCVCVCVCVCVWFCVCCLRRARQSLLQGWSSAVAGACVSSVGA